MSLDVIVEPDDRGRVSLSKIPGANAERYVGRRLSDGSVILQPAVAMTYNALTSLASVIEARQYPQGEPKDLSAILDRFGRPEISEERLAEVRADIARRRSQGGRSLADLTPAELASLKTAQAAARARAARNSLS